MNLGVPDQVMMLEMTRVPEPGGIFLLALTGLMFRRRRDLLQR